MAKDFKMTVAVGNPGTKKTYKVELDVDKAQPLFGKKIGQEFNGESIGLDGYKLKVTGGSDLSGFPMRRDIEGIGKRRVLLNVGSHGFRSRRYHSIPEGEGAKKKLKETRKGERRRKSIRGNTILLLLKQEKQLLKNYLVWKLRKLSLKVKQLKRLRKKNPRLKKRLSERKYNKALIVYNNFRCLS